MSNHNNVTEITEYPAIDELISYCKTFNFAREYTKGQTVLEQNSKTKYVHLVSEGYVKAYDITAKGEERIVTVMGENYMFPLNWVFKSGPIRDHFFSECLTDTKIYLAPREEVCNFINSRNDIMLELLDLSARRLINLAGYNEYMVSSSLEDRLIYVLYFLGLRFGQKANPIALLPFRLSHHDLACMVGASREATTLKLNILTKKEIIKKVEGHLCIYLNKIDHTQLPKIYNYRTY